MGDFGEFKRPQPPGETIDNSPIKLGEVKDFVRNAKAKSTPDINGISNKQYKNTLLSWHLFWNSYESRIFKKIHRRGLGIGRRNIYTKRKEL